MDNKRVQINIQEQRELFGNAGKQFGKQLKENVILQRLNGYAGKNGDKEKFMELYTEYCLKSGISGFSGITNIFTNELADYQTELLQIFLMNANNGYTENHE